MVLTAYPIIASDTQNMLSSGIEANTKQSINPGNRFNIIPQKFEERGLFMKDTLSISFMRLSTDEKLIIMFEKLIYTQNMIQNLFIIIGILLFVIFKTKSI